MRSLFQHVYEVLMMISEITGFTYNEVNIIAYYILLPFLYIALADKIIKKHIFKLLYLVFVSVTLILVEDFTVFSDWLFQVSVDFLLSFDSIGWDYRAASVIICVILPLFALIGMCLWAFPRLREFALSDFVKRNQTLTKN